MNYWGRIFFLYPEEAGTDTGKGGSPQFEPSAILGQPLDNHVDNCRYLLERFAPRFFHRETRERLLRAAELHDAGKRETFRIGKEEGKLTYSFAGHRFRVPRDDPYVAGLIRAHHEFSVERINSEKACLHSDADRNRFADDLYLLCTADQLEAEMAVKAVEKRQTVHRTFMEFVTEAVGDRFDAFRVVPWPFDSRALSVSIRLMELPARLFRGKERGQIEKALKEEKFTEEQRIEITLMEGDFHE